jgi:hypothetical protein
MACWTAWATRLRYSRTTNPGPYSKCSCSRALASPLRWCPRRPRTWSAGTTFPSPGPRCCCAISPGPPFPGRPLDAAALLRNPGQQSTNLRLTIATMTAKCPERAQFPRPGPPCHGLRFDAEHGCYLSRREQLFNLRWICRHAYGPFFPSVGLRGIFFRSRVRSVRRTAIWSTSLTCVFTAKGWKRFRLCGLIYADVVAARWACACGEVGAVAAPAHRRRDPFLASIHRPNLGDGVLSGTADWRGLDGGGGRSFPAAYVSAACP